MEGFDIRRASKESSGRRSADQHGERGAWRSQRRMSSCGRTNRGQRDGRDEPKHDRGAGCLLVNHKVSFERPVFPFVVVNITGG